MHVNKWINNARVHELDLRETAYKLETHPHFSHSSLSIIGAVYNFALNKTAQKEDLCTRLKISAQTSYDIANPKPLFPVKLD